MNLSKPQKISHRLKKNTILFAGISAIIGTFGFYVSVQHQTNLPAIISVKSHVTIATAKKVNDPSLADSKRTISSHQQSKAPDDEPGIAFQPEPEQLYYPKTKEIAGSSAGGFSVTADTLEELPPPIVTTMSDEEISKANAQKQRDYPDMGVASWANIDANQAMTQDAILEARNMGDELVRITVSISDSEFDFSSLRGLENDERAARISERKSSIFESQQAMEHQLAALGGQQFSRIWLGGNRVGALVPANTIAGIASLPNVQSVSIEKKGGMESSYDMKEVSDVTHLLRMRQQGLDASYGNRANENKPVRIGIIEHGSSSCGDDHWPGSEHVAFKDWNNGPSRIKKRYFCNDSTCDSRALKTDPPPYDHPHGTMVTGVAIASIEQNQDSTYTTTTSQQQRSGASSEAEVYYYAMQCGWNQVSAALQQAVIDNVDVVNMSFGFEYCREEPSNQTNSNAAIRAAFDAGITLFAATGNGSKTPTEKCRINWPAFRPEIIAVGGLTTTGHKVYANTSLTGGSAFHTGGMPMKTANGLNSTFAGVDLTAPGYMHYTLKGPASGGSEAYESETVGGSSFATPIVAGFAANLRDAFRDAGWFNWLDAGVLTTNILLSGDSWDGWDASSGSNYEEVAPNRRTGYGRFVARYPLASAHDNPIWSWTITGRTTIGDYQTQTWEVNGGKPIPAGLTEFKVAMTFFPENLQDISDLDLYLRECDGGVIAKQTDFDFRNKLFIDPSKVAGKCVQIEVKSYTLAQSNEPYWLAWYYHSDPKH